MPKTRILAVSDTHHLALRLMHAGEYLTCLKPDIVVHLGDFARESETLRLLFPSAPCYAVRGNGDWTQAYPLDDIVEVDGVSVYLCHGHQWSVKSGLEQLRRAAQDHGCGVSLFGHTHVPQIWREDVLLVNPGAIACEQPHIALLTIEGGKAEATLLRCPVR